MPEGIPFSVHWRNGDVKSPFIRALFCHVDALFSHLIVFLSGIEYTGVYVTFYKRGFIDCGVTTWNCTAILWSLRKTEKINEENNDDPYAGTIFD